MTFDPAVVISWLAGAVIAALVLALFWRALFADTSRGRRRCPSCWHDMSGAPSLRCPECGHDAKSERRLFATRRYWGRATTLLLALIVGSLIVRVRVTGENVFDHAPTWVLRWALPHTSATPGPPDKIQLALESRIIGRRVSADETDLLARLVVSGDESARPPSVAWESRYGRIIGALIRASQDAFDRGDNDDPSFAALERFRDLPPRTTMAAPSPWPGDAPLLVEVRIEEWWPPTTYARVRVRDLQDGTEQLIGLDSGGFAAPGFPFAFGPIAAGESQRTFRVTVEARATRVDGHRDSDAAWGPVHVEDIVVPLVVGSPAPALTPVATPAMDEALAQVFSEGIIAWRTGLRRFGLRFDPSRTGEADFAGVLVGLDVEILEGTIVRRHSRMWWPAGLNGRQTRWEILSEDFDALERLIPAATGWSVRVRGDRDIAQRALAIVPTGSTGGATTPFTKYWSGERTIPMRIQLNDGPAPRRRWFALPPEDVPTPSTPPASMN